MQCIFFVMDSPSLETVYQAIGALYDNPNANEKEKASLWLADMQKSVSLFLILLIIHFTSIFCMV